MNDKTRLTYFSFFNEIGIIAQLSRSLLEAGLPDDLTAPHFSVVNHLVRVKDGQTPLTLAKAFQVPKTTMTHTLAGLERHGLIDMRPNPRDGRSKCVFLTNKGRTFREQAIASLEPEITALSGKIQLKDLEALLPALTEIRQILDSHRNDRDGL